MNCPRCNRRLNSIGACVVHGIVETTDHYATVAVTITCLALALAFLWAMVHLTGIATG